MMSTRHPRPLLIRPFIHLYLSGVSGGIQLTGRTLGRGQLGSLASVSPLTQGGRRELLCVWGSLAGNACGSRLLRRAALPSQRLLPVHTNGLASHPRQPLPLLSSLSSHTRLGLRSICSPHSRHAHVSEPFSLHRCMRVSTHRDTRTCPVLTHQTRPDRIPASLQHTPSSTI